MPRLLFPVIPVRFRALLCAPVVFGALLAGCASQEKLTADAVQCGTREVSIIPSRFSQMGSETAWCAICRGTVYRCVSNAQRSRTECVPSREGDGCGG